MALVAVSMKLTPSTLEEKGVEREARRLHSITCEEMHIWKAV